jgi:hypothetical protein
VLEKGESLFVKHDMPFEISNAGAGRKPGEHAPIN